MKIMIIRSLMLLLFCHFAGAQLNQKPEAPAIDRDVHLTENNEYTRPYTPPIQSTADGRVGVMSQQIGGKFVFHLLVPEKIAQPYIDSVSGIGILSDPLGYRLHYSNFAGPEANPTTLSHIGLCDGSLSAQHNTNKNPYNCGGDDCYDVTVIMAPEDANDDSSRSLWGTELTIQVGEPKKASAFIRSVTVGTPQKGTSFPIISLFEPMTTKDGHLLVARTDGSFHTWYTDEGLEQFTKSDIVYFINDNPTDFSACDVTQWDEIYPITHAPYDSTLNQTYGFAMQPFRDGLGDLIPDGKPLGTYPWIDKNGDNLALTVLDTPLTSYAGVNHPNGTHYPVRCPDGVSSCASIEDSVNPGNTKGRTFMGLWTNGKMVTIDNILNNTDYGIAAPDHKQREINLYENPEDTTLEWLRIGNGRHNKASEMPEGSPGNTTLFDTQEHRFNFFENLKAVSPHDVAWLVSDGATTDELSFDDYINPDGIVVSHMRQAVKLNVNGVTLQFNGLGSNGEGSGSAWIANAATAPPDRWNIPSYGEVTAGRIEPVANGGIKGKGFWLDGENTSVTYQMPAQSRNIRDYSWYLSLFVDSRFDDQAVRSLVKFPDLSEIKIRGRQRLEFIDQSGTTVHEIILPESLGLKSWSHLGFQLSSSNKTIETFHNGFLFDTLNTSQVNNLDRLFEFTQGQITLGKQIGNSHASFRGWIDEFKVFAQKLNLEVACNQALGTLVAVSPENSSWNSWASQYPQSSHQRVRDQVRKDSSVSMAEMNYACYHDFTSDYAAHLRNIPSTLTAVRESIIFPEGPLYHDIPRPDSSENKFCLSCHTAEGRDGMGLEALSASPIIARNDIRRQPSQPNPKVFGNIPANWLDNGFPVFDTVTDVEGFSIDMWVLSGDVLFLSKFED